MTSRCVDEEDLVRLVDGELTENEAERFRQHVRTCAVCAAHSEGLRRALHELKAPLADVDPDAAIEDVMRQLPTAVADASAARARPRTARFRLLGGALAAVLAVSALVVAPRMFRGPGDDSGAFGARGTPMGTSMAQAVGVRLSRSSGSGDPLAPGAHVRPDDAYAIRYKNLLRDPVYLLAFAVDAAGTVHWLCPAYLDPRTNPAAVPLSPSITEASLPSAMQFDAPSSGRMRFIAIVSSSPLHVLDLEALRGAELATTSLRARWPTADVRELVTVDVDSSP